MAQGVAELAAVGTGGVGVSVFIHIQAGGKKGTFLRGVSDDWTEESVVAEVRKMLANPDAHNLSKVKAKSPWAKRRQPALRPDEEVMPGVEVDASVEKALAT